MWDDATRIQLRGLMPTDYGVLPIGIPTEERRLLERRLRASYLRWLHFDLTLGEAREAEVFRLRVAPPRHLSVADLEELVVCRSREIVCERIVRGSFESIDLPPLELFPAEPLELPVPIPPMTCRASWPLVRIHQKKHLPRKPEDRYNAPSNATLTLLGLRCSAKSRKT